MSHKAFIVNEPEHPLVAGEQASKRTENMMTFFMLNFMGGVNHPPHKISAK